MKLHSCAQDIDVQVQMHLWTDSTRLTCVAVVLEKGAGHQVLSLSPTEARRLAFWLTTSAEHAETFEAEGTEGPERG